jgi:hypothetical protein
VKDLSLQQSSSSSRVDANRLIDADENSLPIKLSVTAFIFLVDTPCKYASARARTNAFSLR